MTETPSTIADQGFETLRTLAQNTRSIDEPTEVYAVLGSLRRCLSAIEQTLHQVGTFHDNHGELVLSASGRGTSYQVSWELHRAAMILHQAAAGIDRAHQAEAAIVYQPAPLASVSSATHAGPTL